MTPTEIVSIKKKVLGWSVLAGNQLGMASIPKTDPTQNKNHASLFSRDGSFQAETQVGIAPITSTKQLVAIAKTGL